MGKVSKYNYYMFKQEEQLSQMRRANKMVNMRTQLDEQIREKNRIKGIENQQKQAIDKQVKQEEMKKVMFENESRKKKLTDQQAVERQEDIDLQQKAIKLAEDLEAQRAKDLKIRSDRIQALISVSEDKVKDIANKNLEMDMRNKRYQELRERCLQEKTRKEEDKERTRKVLLKQFLDQQVNEKNARLGVEKSRMNEQADLWKTDCQKFSTFNGEREAEKHRIMQDYKGNLVDQMEIRKNMDKKWRCDMNPNEREMNKELLNKIESIDLKKMNTPNPYEINDNVF